MANIRSSEKDARRSAAQATRNRSIRSSVKTAVTRARKALVGGGEGGAEQVLAAVSSLDRAVTKGVLHRNNAARRKARLMKRLSPKAETAEKPSEVGTTRAAAPKRRTATTKKAATGAKRSSRGGQSGK